MYLGLGRTSSANTTYRANCSEVIDRLLETTLITELKATTNDSEQQHCQADDDMSLKATEAKTIKHKVRSSSTINVMTRSMSSK
ncbi:MAG: hypothetical protein EZS28_017811 [Streblomastix strix]|uniref:Uncharacterized protein n=1 Tax=Streblomastix strix TaxID=222440 RepID=A0A5J4VWF3_9EUKA|nr:MAG: hypothetical protein EZS28_017811 [Streblomastix strix]